jgi:hypothetical protein
MLTREILDEIYYLTDHPIPPETVVKERAIRSVNRHYYQILSAPWARRLLSFQGQFPSVPGQHVYGLGSGVDRVVRIWESTQGQVLMQKPWDWYRSVCPDPTRMTGMPQCWVNLGSGPVANQPTGNAALEASQTNASMPNEKVSLGGTTGWLGQPQADQAGTLYYFRWTSTLDPTGAHIPASGGIPITTVTRFTREAGSGTIPVLWEGVKRLGAIEPLQTHAKVLRIALWPTPSDYLTFRMDYEARIDPLVVPELGQPTYEDKPYLLPVNYHDALVLGGKSDEYEKKNDKRYPIARQDLEQRKRELKAWLYNHRAQAYYTGDEATIPSQLGPWFPAGS